MEYSKEDLMEAKKQILGSWVNGMNREAFFVRLWSAMRRRKTKMSIKCL